MQIDEVIDDLQNLIKRKITYKELAPILGFKTGSAVQNWAYRKRNLKDFEIQKIYEYFGKENLLKQNISDENNKPKIKADYYYDVFGSCGSGAFALSECKRPIDVPVEAIKNFSKVKKYSIINAVGDSMLPYIHDKDLLIVEHTSDIADNQIYVFCYNDTIFVKRLVKNINKIVIISDNPDKNIYENITLENEEINNIVVIGQIVGLMRQCK